MAAPLASVSRCDLISRSTLTAAVLCSKDAPMPVSFKDLLDSFELASMGSSSHGEHQAYLCRESGRIYWHSDFSDLEQINDELPEDIDDHEKYVQLPDKRELDLGKPLVLDFAREVLPQDFDEVRQMFRKRGAYARFKDLLTRRRLIEQWYDFERKATERALREWCEDNLIDLTD